MAYKSIIIKSVETTWSNPYYSFRISWMTEPQNETEKVNISFIKDGVEEYTALVSNTGFYILSNMISSADICSPPEGVYAIQVGNGNGTVKSQTAQLLLDTYIHISTKQERGILTVSYQCSSKIRQGTLLLDNGVMRKVFLVEGGHNSVRISLEAEDWMASDTANLTMTPYSEPYISGPPNSETVIPMREVVLDSIRSITADKDCFYIEAGISLFGESALSADIIVNPACRLASVQTSPVSEEVYRFTFQDAPDMPLFPLIHTGVFYLNTVIGENQIGNTDDSSGVSLATPWIETVKYGKKGVCLSWKCSSRMPRTTYLAVLKTAAGTEKMYTDDPCLEVPYDKFMEDETASVSVMIYDGLHTGNPSESEKLFLPGFYFGRSEENEAVLKAAVTTKDETDLYLFFPGELFDQPLTEELKENGFSMVREDDGYTLHIFYGAPAEKEDFQNFITRLSENHVNPRRMYEILDCLGRTMKTKLSEALFYAYGMDYKNRCMDIRPGITLGIETEQYDIGGTGGKSPNGYIMSHQARYVPAVLNHEGREYLSFHSFLSGIMQSVGMVRLSEEDGGGGGVLDLCSPGMRYPYFRMQYPAALENPEIIIEPYGDHHPILIGSTDYGNLLKASQQYRDTQSLSGYENWCSSFYFRGRAAMTAEIDIWLDGERILVPVGTSLRQIAERTGIYGTDSGLEIQRSIGKCMIRDKDGKVLLSQGEKLPIYIQLADGTKWEELQLLEGDSIICRVKTGV